MSLLSAVAGRKSRVSLALIALVFAAAFGSLQACGDRGEEDHVPEHRADEPAEVAATDGEVAPLAAVDTGALAPLLARARTTARLPDADRLALEHAMQGVLEPATRACDGCRTAVSYVDEAGGGDHFRCDLLGQGDELMADLELYHRPDLPADAARKWARSTVAGHPASELPGEHLFVWPGRFEIRAFGRAASLRGDQALERLVASLPLDELAKL